jgi:hypothetical protein
LHFWVKFFEWEGGELCQVNMPAITKKPSKLRLEFVANIDSSVYGGLPAVEALCQQFGLCLSCLAFPTWLGDYATAIQTFNEIDWTGISPSVVDRRLPCLIRISRASGPEPERLFKMGENAVGASVARENGRRRPSKTVVGSQYGSVTHAGHCNFWVAVNRNLRNSITRCTGIGFSLLLVTTNLGRH